MRRQCECGNEVFELAGSASTGTYERCQKCGRPAASYAKPIPLIGSKQPPTEAEGWRELGPNEVIWRGDLLFGSVPDNMPPAVHEAVGSVGFTPRASRFRFFRSSRYRIEDIPLTEWRKREGGDDRFDQLHLGQRVTTIYRADGSVFLSSGHRPDEPATWTAEQIVAAIGGEQP